MNVNRYEKRFIGITLLLLLSGLFSLFPPPPHHQQQRITRHTKLGLAYTNSLWYLATSYHDIDIAHLDVATC